MHYIWKSSAQVGEKEQGLYYRIPDSEGITLILTFSLALFLTKCTLNTSQVGAGRDNLFEDMVA